MAKKGLGRGVGALLSEANIDANSFVSGESSESTLSKSKGGLHNFTLKKDTLPSCIEVDENNCLWVDPTLLKPNPHQPRLEFNQKQLDELCESIKANGILQPIIIEQVEGSDNSFYIIAGERRTRASIMAGLSKVPVQLRKFDEQQKLEMALIENIQRADLNPIEEATAYYNLIQMADLSQDEVAKRVGKNRSTVANSIRLLRLPEDIKKSLSNGQISAGHARALLMVKTDADMRVIFGKIIGSDLSVREAEELAASYNNGGRATAKKKETKKVKKDPDVENFEQELRNIFGVRDVNLKGDTSKGTLEIKYGSAADFDRIYEVLLGKK